MKELRMDKQKGFVEFVGLSFEPMALNHRQQPNMDAAKLPSRMGIGNDMQARNPNAENNSRFEYCSNEHGNRIANLKP